MSEAQIATSIAQRIEFLRSELTKVAEYQDELTKLEGAYVALNGAPIEQVAGSAPKKTRKRASVKKRSHKDHLNPKDVITPTGTEAEVRATLEDLNKSYLRGLLLRYGQLKGFNVNKKQTEHVDRVLEVLKQVGKVSVDAPFVEDSETTTTSSVFSIEEYRATLESMTASELQSAVKNAGLKPGRKRVKSDLIEKLVEHKMMAKAIPFEGNE